MKVLVDVCLSAALIDLLNDNGHLAVHWSSLGAGNAKDSAIMRWSAENGHVIVSADLDFGDLLALTKAAVPSVILIRSSDQSPQHIAPYVVEALDRFSTELDQGCLISVDEDNARMRILPLK